MIVRTKTCTHCGVEYPYYLSGHIGNPHLNDEKYCPDCRSEMLQALKTVPIKYANVYVDASDEITLEELYAKEASDLIKEKDAPVLRRVFPALMGHGNSFTTRIIEVNGVEYYLQEWTNFHEYNIQRLVRWDLLADVAVNAKDNKPREVVKLYNPNKSSKPVEPFSGSVAPMTRPLSLEYALKFEYNPEDH